MNQELCRLTLQEAVARQRAGTLTSEAYAVALLARIAHRERHLGAFAWFDPDAVLAEAQTIQRASPAGPFRGIPIGIKDIFDTAGIPTAMGSPAFFDHSPARSATLVERIRAAGGSVLGKTVTAELAFYVPGRTRNPWNLRHTPGGSSSGSAAAVAAGFTPAALGTQTNGSVIRPAAYCGVIGFKPTAGWLPRGGILRFSATLDQVGFFTRDFADAMLLLAALAGPDARDPAALDRPKPAAALVPRTRAPRLLAVRSPVWERAEDAAQEHFLQVLSLLRAAGAEVEEHELPEEFLGGYEMHRVIMYAEGARSLVEVQRRHSRLLSGAVNMLVEEGLAMPEDMLARALEERAALIDKLCLVLAGYDAIITPPASGEAPPTLTSTGDPIFCTLWTLCGAPALTFPTGRGPAGLPFGTQLVGHRFEDGSLLSVGAWCQQALKVPVSLAD